MASRGCSRLNRGLAAMLCLAVSPAASGQRPTTETHSRLLVEGRVARLYESSDGSRLVELHLQSVALDDANAPMPSARIPAPGEALFVVVKQAPASTRRLRSRPVSLPARGDSIRGLLQPGDRGTWVGQGAWLEPLAGRAASDERASRDEPFEQNPTSVEAFGMVCEATLVGGKLGLKVKSVGASSVAKEAGFQPGDIVIGVNGRPVSSAADLRASATQGAGVTLSVVDVNSGRVAQVELAGAARDQPAPPAVERDDPASQIAKALGITVEPVRVGLRRAIRVAKVTPDSPGAAAGLEPGDAIVQVGDTRVSSEEELAQAIGRKPARLMLMVHDVRSGKNVPTPVMSDGLQEAGESRKTAPREPAPRRGTASGGIGVDAELAFYNAEAAVKVVRVRAGSPAARAGIRAGMILLKADGQPLLHPNDLAKAEKAARGGLTLRVVNPDTRRESTVNVEL